MRINNYQVKNLIYNKNYKMGTVIGCCYSCFCCECNSMIFPFPQCSYSKESYGQMLQTFQNSSGNIVPYLYMPYKDSKINVIYFHGNAQDIGYSANFLEPIRQKLKATIYAIQYPSYGKYEVSIPARISNRIKSDAEEFFERLKRQSPTVVSQNNTLIIGRSIGSGGATHLASRKKIQNLVLISPFSTIPNVAQDFVGCVGKIVKCHFNNIEQIRHYRGRLLVIHGQIDEVINFKHGQQVVDQYNKYSSQRCKFVAPINMSHNRFDMDDDILKPIFDFSKGMNKTNKLNQL